MALIKCVDCGKELSDRANACPNCGCPIENSLVTENSSTVEKNEEIVVENKKPIYKKVIAIAISLTLVLTLTGYLIINALKPEIVRNDIVYIVEQYLDDEISIYEARDLLSDYEITGLEAEDKATLENYRTVLQTEFAVEILRGDYSSEIENTLERLKAEKF